MQGLYLYCFLDQPPEEDIILAKGMYPDFPVTVLKYNGIGAAISKIPLNEFNEEVFHEKISNNIAWIEDKARKHTFLLEQIHERFNIIPVQFFTIFLNNQSILQLLHENYHFYKAMFQKIEGMSEWTIKVYYDETKAFANAAIEERIKKVTGNPEISPGKAYLLKKKLEKNLKNDMYSMVQRKLDEVVDILRQQFQDVIISDCYEVGESNIRYIMVLNCSVLAQFSEAEAMTDLLEKQIKESKIEGLSLECSGPWPPYSFTTVNTERHKEG
jgi:hypothetical protein